MDALRERLADVLRAVAVDDALCSETELRAPWGILFPEFEGQTMFHLVLEGRLWVRVGDTARWVEPGEFVLLPHGKGHVASSHPGAPCVGLFDAPRRYLNPRYEILRHGGEGPLTRTLCGVSRLGNPATRRLARALPELIAMPSEGEATRFLVEAIFEESRQEGLGGLDVVAKLTEVLILRTLRSAALDPELPRAGWLGALADPRVGAALAAIHARPAEPWSLAELARRAGVSRSGLAARFARLVGEPPMAYLARWRLEVAAERLAGGDDTLEAVARDVGYDSAAALSHAFKRRYGVAPGAYRIEARRRGYGS